MTGDRPTAAATVGAVVERAGFRLFAGMAAFGLLTGMSYGFLTWEVAGTVLLVAFGVASTVAGLAVYLGFRRRGSEGASRSSVVGDSTRTFDRRRVAQGEGRSPAPGWAPFGIAVGLGALAIGAAFGPGLLVLGVIVVGVAARTWLAASVRESGSRL
jgi:hypothetical protein